MAFVNGSLSALLLLAIVSAAAVRSEIAFDLSHRYAVSRRRSTMLVRFGPALMTLVALALGVACSPGDPGAQSTEPKGGQAVSETSAPSPPNLLRNAYFGDLHIHTRNSFDAFIIGTTATPDDAYRYAKGAALVHPLGFEVRLGDGPLDFYAVTDHAVFLGMLPAMADPTTEVSKLEIAESFVTARDCR